MTRRLFQLLMLLMIGLECYAQIPQKQFHHYEQFVVPDKPVVIKTKTPFVIQISNEDQLNHLNDLIRDAIKKNHKDIQVDLLPGRYYYNTLPIYLYRIDAPDVNISICGHGASMVAGGQDFSLGASIKNASVKSVYLGENLDLLNMYGDVHQLSSPVKIVDPETKLCRISITERINFEKGLKIQLSEWYHSPIYEITRIEDNSLYFIADDLQYDSSKGCYNVNYDYGVGRVFPRFRLISSSLVNKSRNRVHESSVSSFLCLYQIKLKSFSLSDFAFNGCAAGSEAMMYFREVDADLFLISNCEFKHINNRIIKLVGASNFVLEKNQFLDCFYDALYSYLDCKNTIVRNNEFCRMGRAWTNSSCVMCLGQDFVVSDNKFYDIGYCAIYSGAHSNWTKNKTTRGVIERNEICFGKEYFDNSANFTLIDGGAVYFGTMIDLVILRYNYIHNLGGVGSNRAVYCDEGTMNVKIYGNVIHSITHGEAILSWRARSINKSILDSNDGIDVYYNVIWGKYRFDERENSSCIHGKNLILYDEKEGIPANELKNFAYQETDVFFSGATIQDNKIVLPRKAKRELRRFPTYAGLMQWIE